MLTDFLISLVPVPTDPEDILEIGLATGALARVLVNGPGVRTLTSVEINPGYLKMRQ